MLPRRADAVLLLETGVGLRFFFGISAELENEHRYYKMILPSLLVSYYGGAWFGSNCARRTTTASSWGFREHGEPTRLPPLTFPSFPIAHRIHVHRPCNGCNPIRP